MCGAGVELVDGIQAEPCPELVAGVLHRIDPAVSQVGAVRPGDMHEQAVAELLAVAAFDRPARESLKACWNAVMTVPPWCAWAIA